MPDRFVESHIRQIPIFANLPAEQFGLIAEAFEVRSYNPGEVVFSQGDATLGLLKFVNGQAQLIRTLPNGQHEQLGLVGANQILNQNAIYQTGVETASLIVEQSATVLKLPRQAFLTIVSHHPEIKQYIGMTSDPNEGFSSLHFTGQRENEEIFVYTRRHWWAWIRLAWLPLLIMVAMWIGAGLVQTPALSLVIFVFSIILPGIFALYLYAEWHNDLVIVTDQRIIRIRRVILTFRENISEVAIESVHEVNTEIPANDPFARFFDYGTIELKTAGSAGNIELDFVPNPIRVQDIIIEDRQHYQDRQEQKHRNAMRAQLERWMNPDAVPEMNAQQGAPSIDPDSVPKQVANASLRPLRTKIVLANGDIIYRKHWIVWLRNTILPIAVMIFAVVEVLLSLIAGAGLLGATVGVFVFLIGAVAFFFADWDWRNDYYIVTDSTITMIHRRPLWLQSLNDQILLERVDNVVSDYAGLFANLFGYGDVRVSLIGADQHKNLGMVPSPQEVQADISRRQARVKQRQRDNDARKQQEIIGEYLSLYHEMQGQYGLVPNPQQAPPHQTVQPNPSVPAAPIPQQQTSPSAPPTGSSQDRVRPPRIPRRNPQAPSRPTMSPGVPYNPPPPRDRSRPPRPNRFPRRNNSG